MSFSTTKRNVVVRNDDSKDRDSKDRRRFEDQDAGPSFSQQKTDLREIIMDRRERGKNDCGNNFDNLQRKDLHQRRDDSRDVSRRDFRRHYRPPPATVFDAVMKADAGTGRFSKPQRPSPYCGRRIEQNRYHPHHSRQERQGCSYGKPISSPSFLNGPRDQRPTPYSSRQEGGRRLEQNQYHPHHSRQERQGCSYGEPISSPSFWYGPKDPLRIVEKTALYGDGNYRDMRGLLNMLGVVRRPLWFGEATPKQQVKFLKESNNAGYLDLGFNPYGEHVALFFNKDKPCARVISSGATNCVTNCVTNCDPDNPNSQMFAINSYPGKYDVTPDEDYNLRDEIGGKEGFNPFCPTSMPRTDEQGGRSLIHPTTILAKVIKHKINKMSRKLPNNASVAVVDFRVPIPPKTARITGDLENETMYEDSPPSISLAPDFVRKEATLDLATIIEYPCSKCVIYNTEGTWKMARYTSADAFRSANLDKTNNGTFGIYGVNALSDFISANKEQFHHIKSAANLSAAELKRAANDVKPFVQNNMIDVTRAKVCPKFREKKDGKAIYHPIKALPFTYCECETNPPFTKGAVDVLEDEISSKKSDFQKLCDTHLSVHASYCFRLPIGPLEHNYDPTFTYGGIEALKAENNRYADEEKRRTRAATQAAFGIQASQANVNFDNEEACGRCKTGVCQLVYVWHNDKIHEFRYPIRFSKAEAADHHEFKARFASFEEKNDGVLKRQAGVTQDAFVREAMNACKDKSGCGVEFRLSDYSWVEKKTKVYQEICSVLGDDGPTNPTGAIVFRFFNGPRDDALSNAIISVPRRGRDEISKCFEANNHTLAVFCISTVFYMVDGLILKKKIEKMKMEKMEKRGNPVSDDDMDDDMEVDMEEDAVPEDFDAVPEDFDAGPEDFPFKSTDIIKDEEMVIATLEDKLPDDYKLKDLYELVCRKECNFGINSTTLFASICDGFKNMLDAEKEVANDFVNQRQDILNDIVGVLCRTMNLGNFYKSVIQGKCDLTDVGRKFNPHCEWESKLMAESKLIG